MASRAHTDVFISMRNNAIQRRNIYSEQNNPTDRMSLVALNNLEEGYGLQNGDSCSMPPRWITTLEETQYNLSRLRDKINELKSLHIKHYNRPTFDDSTDQEMRIENLSNEISRMFTNSHHLIQHIKSQTYEGNRKEQLLTSNVVRALAASLQELSTNFRSTQNKYLKQLNSREENTKNLSDFNFENDDTFYSMSQNEFDDYFVGTRTQKQMTQQQLLLLEEENTRVASERQKEVSKIVKSIVEINEIYKDLAHMVQEQGTVLDRIDYNIENTQMQVHEGFKQLRKAENYQRKNRKICCIIILAITTVFMVFLLIIVKT